MHATRNGLPNVVLPSVRTDTRGDVHSYRVVGVTRVRKRRFPTEAVYGHSSHPVLVLVTCGGPFVEGRGYRDNVLVYARSA